MTIINYSELCEREWKIVPRRSESRWQLVMFVRSHRGDRWLEKHLISHNEKGDLMTLFDAIEVGLCMCDTLRTRHKMKIHFEG